jgi:xanthine dehydrogenase YagR molybdenum-binding subunit
MQPVSPEPRSIRDGRYLIGRGVAAAIYWHWRWPAKVRVTLRRDGTALVETGLHNLGIGTYTVMQKRSVMTICINRGVDRGLSPMFKRQAVWR